VSPITFKYQFSASNFCEEAEVNLDPQTLEYIPPQEAESPPPWVALEYHQCPNCPLQKAQSPTCPLALNIAYVVKQFESLASFDLIHLRVTTQEREISADTTIQRAIGSLFGLIIATSNCPHCRFLRPMARFHLPLATEEETIFRTTSTYLLAQYFRHKTGDQPDLAMKGLAEAYQELHQINAAIASRIKGANKTDSSVNAVILLDLLAKAVPYTVEESLEEIKYLFNYNTNNTRVDC